MAGSRIKGITVEIGGDTTGLDKALKSVNSTIRTTQSSLRDVNKLLKLDPANTELVTQKQRLSAKLLVSLEINVISMLIMLIPAMILLPVPPLYMLAGFVMALMLSVFPAAVSMVIDARHPKLNWMSETDALKKNFNSFFCIVLWVVAAAVTAITAFLLSRVSPAAMLIGLAACAVILCAGSLWFLNRAADQCNTLPED